MTDGAPISIRRARDDDVDVLAAMLVEAVAWRPDAPRPPVGEVLARPEFGHYLNGWPLPHDAGVVAEAGDADGAPSAVGAAWYRLLSAGDPGYGFIDDATPEVTIGVDAPWRGLGIGRRLLTALVELGRAEGLTALSLSVEDDNPARFLYQSVGFGLHEQVGNAWTMVISLR